MKKYFLFDNESISGTTYLLRVLLSTLLVVVIVGFWLAAATAYKRSGSFKWSKELRILCAIAIPIHLIINILADELEFSSPTFSIVVIIIGIIHLILLFKNGNK